MIDCFVLRFLRNHTLNLWFVSNFQPKTSYIFEQVCQCFLSADHLQVLSWFCFWSCSCCWITSLFVLFWTVQCTNFQFFNFTSITRFNRIFKYFFKFNFTIYGLINDRFLIPTDNLHISFFDNLSLRNELKSSLEAHNLWMQLQDVKLHAMFYRFRSQNKKNDLNLFMTNTKRKWHWSCATTQDPN